MIGMPHPWYEMLGMPETLQNNLRKMSIIGTKAQAPKTTIVEELHTPMSLLHDELGGALPSSMMALVTTTLNPLTLSPFSLIPRPPTPTAKIPKLNDKNYKT